MSAISSSGILVNGELMSMDCFWYKIDNLLQTSDVTLSFHQAVSNNQTTSMTSLFCGVEKVSSWKGKPILLCLH